MSDYSLVASDEFLARAQEFKDRIRTKITEIRSTVTPQVDGEGREIRSTRDDGYEYVIEIFVRCELDRLFPGWSWEPQGPPMFLGGEWCYWYGILTIIDENLLGLGVIPPVRKFGAGNAVRIKYGRGKAHTPDGIVDVGNDVAGANSKAFKKAVNSLTHICDDVYKKSLDYEGMGTYEDLLQSTGSLQAFNQLVKQYGLRWGEIFEILGVSSLAEVTDYKEALATIHKAKGY